jgi:predicted RNA-binding protein with PIN domain
VICVWDARGGPSMYTQHDTLTYGVEVVYEAEYTADTYIEAKSRELLSITHNRPLVFVATDDRATRDLVNAQGSLTLTTTMLIQVRGVPQEQLPLVGLEGTLGRNTDDSWHSEKNVIVSS